MGTEKPGSIGSIIAEWEAQGNTDGLHLKEAKPRADLSKLVEMQAEWDRQDREASAEAFRERDRSAVLEAMGFPVANRKPAWALVPQDCRQQLVAYCESLQVHVTQGMGLFLGSAVGAGKTSMLALLAQRAEQLHVPAAYVVAGFALHEILKQDRGAYQTTPLLLLDDLDYVSTAGYEQEQRSWDLIGQALYLRDAAGLSTVVACNDTWEVIAGKPGMARVVSRWARSIPEQFRLETGRGDQRQAQE